MRRNWTPKKGGSGMVPVNPSDTPSMVAHSCCNPSTQKWSQEVSGVKGQLGFLVNFRSARPMLLNL